MFKFLNGFGGCIWPTWGYKLDLLRFLGVGGILNTCEGAYAYCGSEVASIPFYLWLFVAFFSWLPLCQQTRPAWVWLSVLQCATKAQTVYHNIVKFWYKSHHIELTLVTCFWLTRWARMIPLVHCDRSYRTYMPHGKIERGYTLVFVTGKLDWKTITSYLELS